jgi:hypothetical protein
VLNKKVAMAGTKWRHFTLLHKLEPAITQLVQRRRRQFARHPEGQTHDGSDLTFDMSGGLPTAQPAVRRPFDGGVRPGTVDDQRLTPLRA